MGDATTPELALQWIGVWFAGGCAFAAVLWLIGHVLAAVRLCIVKIERGEDPFA